MITFSTVGFGDLAPKSHLGRCLGSLFMIIGVGAFAILVTELFKIIDRHKGSHRQRWRCTLEVFNSMDVDRTGRISRSEFLRYMLVCQGKVRVEALQQIDELFEELDTSRH